MELKPDERIDDLERCGYKIIQNTKKFCFGIDAVLLSGFAKANKGDKVVDLGTGTGILPILMEAKTDNTVVLNENGKVLYQNKNFLHFNSLSFLFSQNLFDLQQLFF